MVDNELYLLEQLFQQETYYVQAVKEGRFDVETGDDPLVLTPKHFPRTITFDTSNYSQVQGIVNQQLGSLVLVGDRFFIYRSYLVPNDNDYIVYDGKRYNIREHVHLDHRAGTILQTHHVQNQEYELTQEIDSSFYVNIN